MASPAGLSGGPERGSTDRKGATPQAEGLVQARGHACFHTLAAALQGSLPVHGSLGGKAVQRRWERGVSTTDPASGSRVSSANYAVKAYAAKSGTRPSRAPAFAFPQDNWMPRRRRRPSERSGRGCCRCARLGGCARAPPRPPGRSASACAPWPAGAAPASGGSKGAEHIRSSSAPIRSLQGDRHAVESVIDMPWNQQSPSPSLSQPRSGSIKSPAAASTPQPAH